MAYSFCWRYACLPDSFSSSEFTANMSGLAKYNIGRMPGGVVYNATIKATPGVKVDVTAASKTTAVDNVYFNNYGQGLPTGDWVWGNITLPPGALSWPASCLPACVPLTLCCCCCCRGHHQLHLHLHSPHRL